MEFDMKSKVYIQTDTEGRILRCDGGYTTPADLTDWTYIDEGTGDRYNLCQGNYFDGGLYTDDGIPRYKLVNGAPVLRSEDELEADILPSLREAKHAEISAANELAIYAGIDVETTQGAEHFSLTDKDQINLAVAKNAVDCGDTEHLYHADGKEYRSFTADEIRKISQAAMDHIMRCNIYCNHVFAWINESNSSELDAIVYGSSLPEHFSNNIKKLLNG